MSVALYNAFPKILTGICTLVHKRRKMRPSSVQLSRQGDHRVVIYREIATFNNQSLFRHVHGSINITIQKKHNKKNAIFTNDNPIIQRTYRIFIQNIPSRAN